ncbi:hypothetical protein SEPCBS119000_002213 [Sporothrix epigloea]|uniref:DUF2415 domain-containing protein n=1 Tax=Sporothrix epigloea TaxID=1892477 RepID=A0ABP0DF46_9PEZI
MAVEDVADQTACYLSEALIARQPKRHYRTSIHPMFVHALYLIQFRVLPYIELTTYRHASHWQLRSLIGVLQQHLVYFPAGEANLQIQEFNTLKQKSETIAMLLFSPRCLVAHSGWICCGGEEGEFVAIRPKAESRRSDSNRNRSSAVSTEGHDHHIDRTDNTAEDNADCDTDADMDDEEYDDFDMRATDDAPSLATVSSRFIGKSDQFGTDRVNCITIWTPSPIVPLFQGAHNCSIAILSNNDKHVTLVDLDTTQELDILGFPDYVNRSVLSPSGHLLISVSDDPYLYTHKRVKKPPPSGPSRQCTHDSQSDLAKHYEWKLLSRHPLRGQSSDDDSVHRGSFAACFSNTGRYLAVATQYGVIHVFETAGLGSPDGGLIACFHSSNTNVDSGAVREMAFCPGPYDLLAWSEDHGAVGVADARNGFVPRQILSLCDHAAYEHLDIHQTIHISAEMAEERRRRQQAQAFSNAATRNAANEFYELAAGHTPLSLQESQLMGLIHERQLRRERESRGQPAPAEGRDRRDWEQEHLGRRTLSLSRSRSSMFSRGAANSDGNTRPFNGTRNTGSSRLQEQGGNVSLVVNDVLGNIQTLRTVRDAADVERRWDQRGSTFAAGVENDESGNEDDGAATRDTSTLAAALRQQDPMWAAGSGSSAGRGSLSSRRVLDSLHAYALDEQFGSGFVARPNGRRTASRALILPSAGAAGYETIVSTARRAREPGPLEQRDGHTAGLAWSEDGTILFAATEGGIYEFYVNVRGRMFHPSVTMR